FNAVLVAVRRFGGMKITSSDRRGGQVTVKASSGGFGWRANLQVVVVTASPGKTLLSANCTLKDFPGIGTVTPDPVQESRRLNDRIISETRQVLASKPPVGLAAGLIATFAPGTRRTGKTITFEDGRFRLEGHGRVSPGTILRYAEQGELVWANNEAHTWVASRAQAAEEDALNEVSYADAWYVGGLTGLESQCEGTLRITGKRIGILRGFDEQLWASVKMSATTHIVIESEQVAQSRIRATVLLGIVGLATRAAKDRTYLTAYLRSGDFATYMVDGYSATEVRADIAPILKRVGVPFDKPIAEARHPARQTNSSIVDELERLAALRRTGSITDEEYVAFKAKLME
ncbi:MAG: SHOCT domain-containing protein, partial [Armatimonadota bacterium]